MQKIHPQSDLKITANFEDKNLTTETPFEFRYFTTDRNHYVEANFDGTNYKNCQPTADGIIAFWKCPNFYPGTLKVLRHFQQSDTRFDDNVFDLIVAQQTDIEITDQHIITENYDLNDPVNSLKGERGEKGEKGDKGEKGEKGEVDTSYINQQIDAIKIGGYNYFANSMLQLGAIDSGSGVNVASTIRCRSSDFIPFTGKVISAYSVNSTYQLLIIFYDSNKAFISSTFQSGVWIDTNVMTIKTPQNIAYIRYACRKSDNSNLTSADLREIKAMIENTNKPSDWSASVDSTSELKVRKIDGTYVSLIVNGKINPTLL